jgi:ankyrin repeat protein
MKRLLNRYKITNEAKQVGDIYHVCTLNAYLKYIMPNDTLQSSGKYINYLYGGTSYVSFTRDKYFVVGTDAVEMSSVLIQLVIDGNKLSERYKVGPYNDFTYDIETGEFDPNEDNFKQREKEEVVRGPIKNLSKYIKEIRIDSRRNVSGTEAVLLEKNKNKLKNCVYYNFIKDSTHLKALDVLKNGASFNEFLNIVKICVDPKSFAYEVKYGNINDIIDAVDAGYDINAPAIDGDTLLSYYACLNKKDIVKWLFKLGADPNAENMDGSTALDNAVLYNNYEAAKLLLDNGAEIRDNTIDLVASDEMKELLAKYDNSIDLNESYSRLENRISFLEGKADQEMLRKYLGDDYYNKYQLIKNKIKDPEYKDIYKLIKKDSDEVKDYIDSFQSNTDIRRSDKKGATKLYSDDGWDVYKITTYPAAQLYGKNTKWCITGRYNEHEERGEEYFYEYIDEYDLDGGYYFYINKHDPSSKYCVLQTKDKTIESIWNAVDEELGNTFEDVLATDGVSLPYVKEIPDSVINHDRVDAAKMLAAINSGNANLVQKVIDSGIDPNVIVQEGDPALVYACYTLDSDSADVIKTLVRNGADPNYSTHGASPLSILIKFYEPQYTDLMKFLINNGADVNIRDNKNYTPLYYAALIRKRGGIPVAKLLIDNGANTRNVDGVGSSIYELLPELLNK